MANTAQGPALSLQAASRLTRYIYCAQRCTVRMAATRVPVIAPQQYSPERRPRTGSEGVSRPEYGGVCALTPFQRAGTVEHAPHVFRNTIGKGYEIRHGDALFGRNYFPCLLPTTGILSLT
jgi:hypothetical protein